LPKKLATIGGPDGEFGGVGGTGPSAAAGLIPTGFPRNAGVKPSSSVEKARQYPENGLTPVGQGESAKYPESVAAVTRIGASICSIVCGVDEFGDAPSL
jgi:hypothetical protein